MKIKIGQVRWCALRLSKSSLASIRLRISNNTSSVGKLFAYCQAPPLRSASLVRGIAVVQSSLETASNVVWGGITTWLERRFDFSGILSVLKYLTTVVLGLHEYIRFVRRGVIRIQRAHWKNAVLRLALRAPKTFLKLGDVVMEWLIMEQCLA